MDNRFLQSEQHQKPVLHKKNATGLMTSDAPRKQGAKLGARHVLSLEMALDLVAIFEALIIIASAQISAFLYLELLRNGTFSVVKFAALGALCALVVFRILKNNDCYTMQALTNFIKSAGPVVTSIMTGFVILVLVGFALKVTTTYSRIWFATWLSLSVTAILVERAVVQWWLTKAITQDAFKQTVAIVGTGARAQELVEYLSKRSALIDIAGVFHIGDTVGSNFIQGFPIGSLPELLIGGKAGQFDKILLATDGVGQSRLKELLSQLHTLPIDVLAYADETLRVNQMYKAEYLDNLALIKITRRPLSNWDYVGKTVLDYVVALFGLTIAIIPMLIIMVSIKISNPRLPVFFKQKRHGFNHKIFKVIKFRTMRVMEYGQDVVQASKNDQRVTAIGRFLRVTSMDELPQIFNVFRGEMSIVGPRPHALSHNMDYEKKVIDYATRHRVKPGMTGWAQIHGYRGETRELGQMQQRINYDLHYIENWSIWLDIKIIVMTPLHLLFGHGAH